MGFLVPQTTASIFILYFVFFFFLESTASMIDLTSYQITETVTSPRALPTCVPSAK
jgi:hypothetical protein